MYIGKDEDIELWVVFKILSRHCILTDWNRKDKKGRRQTISISADPNLRQPSRPSEKEPPISKA